MGRGRLPWTGNSHHKDDRGQVCSVEDLGPDAHTHPDRCSRSHTQASAYMDAGSNVDPGSRAYHGRRSSPYMDASPNVDAGAHAHAHAHASAYMDAGANVDASACANVDAGASNYPSASRHPGSSTGSGAYASAQACVSLGVGS